MSEIYSRTSILIGEQNINKLMQSRVAIFGIGGVGGYALEALARTGVGELDLIDNDIISKSNINRQIIATTKTIGRDKVLAAKERIEDINPKTKVNIYKSFYTMENAKEFDFSSFDYIVDAIDTVSAKLSLIEEAKKVGTPIISAMGAGNKLDPTMFEVADIYKTSVCPLAKVMRRELRKRDISDLKVVYSKEEAKKNTDDTIGSIAFVPSVVGLIIAGEVIKDIIKS